MFKETKKEYPALVWAERVASRLPSDIEYGLQFLRDERERSYRRVNEFVRDPSWERFSLGDTIKVLGYTGYDVEMELSRPQLEGLAFAATTMEYVKAYGRRTLRYMGVSPLVAQAVVNGAEGGAMLWAGTGAVRAGVGRIPGDVREVASIVGQQGGRQALREASGLSTVERTLLRREAVLPEVGAAGRAEEVLLWDLRGSAQQALTRLPTKEQPWVFREHQQWKEKIVGRAQRTGTRGHGTESYELAIDLAKREDVTHVYLNRGMNRVLKDQGIEIPGIRANTRADVTYVKRDGKIHQLEVRSKTDDRIRLNSRMQDTLQKLPEEMQGTFKTLDISAKHRPYE